jgi:hypothetical protein
MREAPQGAEELVPTYSSLQPNELQAYANAVSELISAPLPSTVRETVPDVVETSVSFTKCVVLADESVVSEKDILI